MADERNPSPKEVQLIFKDVYNFYVKWSNIETAGNFSDLLNDMHELEAKYPFDLCRKMLEETSYVINRSFKERECPDD